MSKIRILLNQPLVLDNVEYRYVRKTGDDRHAFENTETLAQVYLDDEAVAEALSVGRLVFRGKDKPGAPTFDPEMADFESLPESLKREARRRYVYVSACLEAQVPQNDEYLDPIISAVAAERSDPSLPSRATVNRWIERWKAGGGNDLRPLVPLFHHRGRKKWKFPEEVYDLLEEAIVDVHNCREKVTKRAVHEYLQGRIVLLNDGRSSAHKLPTPSLPFVSRKISERDRYEQMLARQGKEAANLKFRPIVKGPLVERPLERVEIDSTPIDLIVRDDITGVALGRPTLTVAFDCYSGMPTGFYLGFEPPCEAAVMQCIRHSILSKSYVKEVYPDIKATWPCSGVMSLAVLDRGTENFGNNLVDSCNSLGIKVFYTPVKSPWFKGRVERFFRSLCTSLIHQLPGTTFSNIEERADYDSVERARLTLSELNHLIHIWIIDYYAKRPHAGIRDVPAEKWDKGCDLYPQRLPESLDSLNCLLGGHKEKPISNKGVELEGLFYSDGPNGELQSLRRRHRDDLKVHIRYDLSDLGCIRVLDPDSRRYFTIAHKDQEYTKGLSVVQHRLIRKLTADEASGKSDTESLALTRVRIVEAAQMAARKSKGNRLVGRELAKLLGLRDRKGDDLDAIKAAAEQYEDRPLSRANHASSMSPEVTRASEPTMEASSAMSREIPEERADTGVTGEEDTSLESRSLSNGGIWIETEGDQR